MTFTFCIIETSLHGLRWWLAQSTPKHVTAPAGVSMES